MAKMKAYAEAQDEERAQASGPDVSEFDRVLSELHALVEGNSTPPPSEE